MICLPNPIVIKPLEVQLGDLVLLEEPSSKSMHNYFSSQVVCITLFLNLMTKTNWILYWIMFQQRCEVLLAVLKKLDNIGLHQLEIITSATVTKNSRLLSLILSEGLNYLIPP